MIKTGFFFLSCSEMVSVSADSIVPQGAVVNKNKDLFFCFDCLKPFFPTSQ